MSEQVVLLPSRCGLKQTSVVHMSWELLWVLIPAETDHLCRIRLTTPLALIGRVRPRACKNAALFQHFLTYPVNAGVAWMSKGYCGW